MTIQEIIEKLCNHEISKIDAIEQIKLITNGLRKNNALEFTVKEVSFGVETGHGYLKLQLPCQYSKIEGKFKQGDKVDVILIP